MFGIEQLVWGWAARDDGPLVAGGVTAGIGTGIVLVAGPLEGADPQVVGGAFLLATAEGFAVVAALSRLWLDRPQRWAWITVTAVGAVGGALLAGGDVLRDLLTWGLPTALLVAGAAAAWIWLRAGRG